MLSINSIASVKRNVNYAYVKHEDVDEWKLKGFKENLSFSSELWDNPDQFVVMTREPITMKEFGIERIIGSEIVDICSYIGTYGMGGAGYFGFKIKINNEEMWIVVCIWNADGYMLLDDKVFYSPEQYIKNHNPWYSSDKYFNNHFKYELCKSKIQKLIINEYDMAILVELGDKIRHIKICNNDNKLAPTGNGFKREDAFNDGNIIDYIVVIPDHSNIFILE
jgi:hypothetical protein